MHVRRVVLLAFVIGCEGSQGPTEQSGSTPGPTPRQGDELLAADEAASVRTQLQGTFAMSWWRGEGERHPEIWSIDGEQLTRWDGSKEEVAELLVVAPCLAKVTWPSQSFTYEPFVIAGDTVWFGEDGGRTIGERTVVCTALGVWVLGPGGCHRWTPGGFSSHRSGLSAEDAKCSLTATGDFQADGETWKRRGDVLVRADFDERRPSAPTRFASLAEAKAATR